MKFKVTKDYLNILEKTFTAVEDSLHKEKDHESELIYHNGMHQLALVRMHLDYFAQILKGEPNPDIREPEWE